MQLVLPDKPQTETQKHVARCKELFHMLMNGKITAKQLEEELKKMEEKPLFCQREYERNR